MAIQVTNFNPVWKYNEDPLIPNNPRTQFYNGTYLFIQYEVYNTDSVNIKAELWDKKPIIETEIVDGEPVLIYSNGAQKINNLNFGSIVTNIEGNVLLASHNTIVEKLSSINPGVLFSIIDI